MSVLAGKGVSVDPRWTGIVEVLVRGLAGTVIWEPGSVVLQLPDRKHAGRVGDLDALRLCLVRVGVPVVFDASCSARPDPSLLDFLRKLVESGLMVDVGRQAA
jgi:hypothetical protein